MVSGSDVHSALTTVDVLLRPVSEQNWDVRAGQLDWTVRETVDHLTDACGFYTVHLASRSPQRLRVDVRPHLEATNIQRLEAALACGAGLAHVVDTTPPNTRGWHYYGMADASGFAAMTCDELLVHAGDMALGLGRTFKAADDICQRVLARLFPWVTIESDPWATLLWANGRVELPRRARIGDSWRWHCAPLDEWDGSRPDA